MNLLLVDGFVEVDVWWMKKKDGQKWERRLFVVVEGLASDVLPSAGFYCVEIRARKKVDFERICRPISVHLYKFDVRYCSTIHDVVNQWNQGRIIVFIFDRSVVFSLALFSMLVLQLFHAVQSLIPLSLCLALRFLLPTLRFLNIQGVFASQ
jgi:hypothetical protein